MSHSSLAAAYWPRTIAAPEPVRTISVSVLRAQVCGAGAPLVCTFQPVGGNVDPSKPSEKLVTAADSRSSMRIGRIGPSTGTPLARALLTVVTGRSIALWLRSGAPPGGA